MPHGHGHGDCKGLHRIANGKGLPCIGLDCLAEDWIALHWIGLPCRGLGNVRQLVRKALTMVWEFCLRRLKDLEQKLVLGKNSDLDVGILPPAGQRPQKNTPLEKNMHNIA